MRAGRLRHRVALQRATETANSFNEPVVSWSTLATVWGAVEPISGKEFFAAQQVQSSVSHRITVRYYAGLTTKDRVLWTDPSTSGQRIFDINAILDRDERHRGYELMCTEHH